MRPRSRLLAKRGLPTIREGYEELVQDLNQTNSQHSSSSTQDYFLSICQLARPTFPLHEPDRDILSIGTLDSPKPCLRLHRLRQPLQLSQTLAGAASTATSGAEHPPRGEDEEMAPSVSSQVQHQEQGVPDGDRPGSAADPLEYLYGPRVAVGPASSSSNRRGSVPSHRERSNTFPRPCSAASVQRKSSCPELRLAEPGPSAAVLQRSPVSRKKLDDGGLRSSIPAKLDGAPPGWRGKSSSSSSRCMDKQTMVSHWIAECRSAWREARIRACMLPAIAEK